MKNHRLEIRLSDLEKNEINSRATHLGIGVAEYVRAASCNKKIRKHEELKQAICWLGRICGNLNSLAKHANYSKSQANFILITSSLKRIALDVEELRKKIC